MQKLWVQLLKIVKMHKIISIFIFLAPLKIWMVLVLSISKPIHNTFPIILIICITHRQLIDRYLTDFSHASSYRKILRAMRILCGNQNAMVIAFCRFCNIIKLQFLYYFKNNVSRAKKLWILMVLILCRNVKSNLHNAPKCL